MSFLHPWAFLGLLSLPAIIALHWHFERQQRVIVSSIFLWAFLDEKFQGRKISFLHISWLLFLDLLIALLLTLALSRPIVKLPALKTSEHQQIILLDDSGSMLALDGASTRFETARQIAAGLVNAAGPKTDLALITFGGEVELVGISGGDEGDNLADQLNRLAPTGRGEDLRAALSVAASLADPQIPQVVTVITDGAYPLPPLDDYPFEIDWRFVGEGGNNQAVLDLALEGVGKPQSDLFFRIANTAGDQVTREIEVSVDGSPVQSRVLTLPPVSITAQTITLTAVTGSVSVRLLGTDDMPADDLAVLGITGSQAVRVAVVADNPYPLDKAISTIPGTALKVFSPSQFTDDGTYDLVIYRGIVPETWPKTTVLIFGPQPTTGMISIGMPVRVEDQIKIEPGSIMEGAGLESVRWEYAAVLSDVNDFETLASSGELPFILRQQTLESDVFLFAPLLETGNFTKHPAFPILLSRFVALARDFSPQPSYQVGDALILPAGKYSIQTPSGEMVDEEAVTIILTEPGLYQFEATDPLGEVRRFEFGVNLGDAVESEIAPQDWRDQYLSAGEEVEREWQLVEVDLGPWLLGAAVLLLLIEAWRAWR
ncbi:MAG: vWA domain-containing protein [Anaerolineales bacterium]